MKKLVLFLCSLSAMAAQTRPVQLSWVASVSSGVTGYTIATAPAATGPFTIKACTGTVPGSAVTCTGTASTTSLQDIQTVGTTVFYQVAAVAAACTPTTPVGTVCGTSQSASASTTVPPQPAISTFTLIVP